MKRKKLPQSKTKTLEALQKWRTVHDPLDIPTLITKNRKLFNDLAEFGLPKDVDLILQTAARLAKQTMQIARTKKELSERYKSANSRRSFGIVNDIANGKIPQGKRWLMGGLPVGKEVVRRILADDPKRAITGNSYVAVADLLKAKYLSIPELMEKTGLGRSQTQSILGELEEKGILQTRRHRSAHRFHIADQRRKSKRKKG